MGRRSPPRPPGAGRPPGRFSPAAGGEDDLEQYLPRYYGFKIDGKRNRLAGLPNGARLWGIWGPEAAPRFF